MFYVTALLVGAVIGVVFSIRVFGAAVRDGRLDKRVAWVAALRTAGVAALLYAVVAAALNVDPVCLLTVYYRPCDQLP